MNTGRDGQRATRARGLLTMLAASLATSVATRYVAALVESSHAAKVQGRLAAARADDAHALWERGQREWRALGTELEPDPGNARAALARESWEARDYPVAEAHFRQAVLDYADATQARAVALATGEGCKRATNEWRALAGTAEPDPGAQARSSAGQLMNRGNYAGANLEFQAAVARYRRATELRGAAVAAARAALAAMEQWQRVALSGEADPGGGCRQDASESMAAGDYAAAQAASERASTVYRERTELLNARATALKSKASATTAREAWLALDKGEDREDRWTDRMIEGNAAFERGDFARAEYSYRKAESGFVAHAAKLKSRGEALAARTEWQESLRELGRGAGTEGDEAARALARAEDSGPEDSAASAQEFRTAAAAYLRLASALPIRRVDLGGGVRLTMMRIPAGKFRMGSPVGDAKEKPLHEVEITREFWLARTEVTQAQWEAVMGNNPSRFRGDPNRPVEQVTWEDCGRFVERLNVLVPRGNFRMPTEAEWEYACRAGAETEYSFGDAAKDLALHGWHQGNASGQTQPVARLKPNAWGLYDLHGNVWEWCTDWHGPYDARKASDPTGPRNGRDRATRGGCWSSSSGDLRCAKRGWGAPSRRDGFVGFRPARSIG